MSSSAPPGGTPDTAAAGNFAFLADTAPLPAQLGALAERLFPFDPASCVLKLRLLAETLTRDIADRLGIDAAPLAQNTQAELLRLVDQRLNLDPQVRQLFHLLRRTGNRAAHEAEHGIGHREGLDALKVARELAVWFQRSFGGQPGFEPGPFVAPGDPGRQLDELRRRLADLDARLQDAAGAHAREAERAALLEAQAAQERELARRAREDSAVYEQLAEEAGAQAARLQAEFEARLAQAASRPAPAAEEVQRLARRAGIAAQQVLLDEAATRRVIDAQLQQAGWEADSARLTHAAGARPERGRFRAIAEWPTQGGQHADYLLFAGLVPLAVVEAKRRHLNVAGSITQSERYARGLHIDDTLQPAWSLGGAAAPWDDGQGGRFFIPFAYAATAARS